MLTIPNFERLRVFHAVFLHRSIQKAADALNVTRSAVSQSLKALEEEIGIRLFFRNSKNFQPTPQAEELFGLIDPFVSELQATLQGFESGIKRPIGHLRIGAPMDFGSNHLTKVIAQFRKKFPEVTFELILAVPIKQLEMLCRGELDLAFIDNGDVHAQKYGVSVQTVLKEEFVLVASKKMHREITSSGISFAKLKDLPVVDYLFHGPVVRMWFQHQFSKIPSRINIVYSAESVRAVLTAIDSGIGVGVVPKHLLVGEFNSLKVIETSKRPLMNEIMLARQEGRSETAREREFIRFYCESSKI